jgi:SAM-dependent methyltransferase
MMSATAPPRPIDPFTRAEDGGYADDAVIVRRRRGLLARGSEHLVARTGWFAIGRDHGRLLVLHDLDDAMIDNDLAALLAAELFDPGWAAGADTFERLMTGVVVSCRDDPEEAWECFYRNTLHRLDELVAASGSEIPTGAEALGSAVQVGSAATLSGSDVLAGSGHGCLAGFAPVYLRAQELIAGAGTRVLADLGSCFGFLPLRVAAGGGIQVIASDLSAGTCRLLERMTIRLRLPVRVLSCDAASVPLQARSADTVTLLHLLEHVPAVQGDRIVREALRLARRRVVIAVPLESVPDPAFGHLRTLDLDELTRCADRLAPEWTAHVFEHHGGWLVLDRPGYTARGRRSP